jgi:hypothetical protein
LLSSSSVFHGSCGSGLDDFQIPAQQQAVNVASNFMITLKDFTKIRNEVIDSLRDAFKLAQANSVDNSYILFLAEAEFLQHYTNGQNNPYVIDYRGDRYMDETRLAYLVKFLNTNYNFPNGQTETVDNDERLHLELMIYTHIWESKPYLKKLFRLAQIIDKKPYNWNVVVPDFKKQEFYRDNIKKPLINNGSSLADTLKKGFHSSLRNAFAHSEFAFDFTKKRIWLYNFKGDTSWELQETSFKEWSTRFSYSFLTMYLLLDLFHHARKTLIIEYGTNEFSIPHKDINGNETVEIITYKPEHDSFNFKR